MHLVMDYQSVGTLRPSSLPSFLKSTIAEHLLKLKKVSQTLKLSSPSDSLRQANACPQGHGSAVRVADL